MQSSPSFTIRPLESINDYLRSEALQREIWQIYDDTAVVPLHVLITAQKNGGLVASAFDETDRMIGFLYGFLGFTASGRVKHCSHLMGVLPELRRSGIGEALKLFQREYVRKQGVDLITWTFDPLEGVNASLNIGKLRSVARTYFPNLYGEMRDNLNKGIPTDRFEVESWINHPRTLQPPVTPPDLRMLLAGGALLVNPADHASAPVPLMGKTAPPLTNSLNPSATVSISPIEAGQLPDTLLVEVPAVYQRVKQHAIELAREWRYHTRAVFETLFASGYVVMDFVSTPRTPESADGPRKNYYILEKEPPIPDV